MRDVGRWALFAVLLASGAGGSATPAAHTSPMHGGEPAAEMESPAGPGSGEPFLAVHGEAVFLSWLEETRPGTHALRLSRWDGERWDTPRTVVESDELFVNWADFPTVVPLRDGGLAAHWPARSGGGTYSYDVVVALSSDGGHRWSTPVRPHRDGTPTEHGFVSLLARAEGGFDAVWLDGRRFEDGGHGKATHEMSLMHARYQNGAFEPERVLDARVCDCCQTGAAAIPGGMIVVYRDRSVEEMRDISYVRLVNGRWSEPRTLHDDGWKIPACPVNGPAVAASGERVAVAWYTAPPAPEGDAAGRATPLPAKDAHVRVIFSSDGGESFGPPVEVDAGRPEGRVDVEMDEAGGAFVSWMEETGDKQAEVRVRRVGPQGRLGPTLTVTPIGGSRASGFPRMVRTGGHLMFAWTDVTADPPRVRVTRLAAPGGTE